MFNSILFSLFLPIVFAIYWLIPGKKVWWQNMFIVIASYTFYGAWDWRFLLLIAFTTLCSWASGMLLTKREFEEHKKLITGFNITINLLILGVFKYYNFFVSSFVELFGLNQEDYVLKNIILPVGISFYTFQALSYSIDVYRKRIEPTRDVVAFFAYVSFFPQLVAGPIERATNLLPQFLNERKFKYDEAVDGCRRMLWGFFKKLLIADNCAVYVNYVWSDFENQSGSTLLLGALFFTFQIYGDFSGYSDIAIGCSKLFGIRLRDNFLSPYFSRDVAEFWKRWHISLNTWFVDYVYIPLGGSREGKAKKIRNTFIIFLLSGLWHGANWTYIAWGLYHAVLFIPLIVFNKNRRFTDITARYSVKDAFSTLCTFIFIMIGWILFRAPSISDAYYYTISIFEKGIFVPAYYEKYTVVPALAGIIVMMVTEWVQRNKRHPLDIGFIQHAWLRILIYYLITVSMILYTGQNQTFLYFQF